MGDIMTGMEPEFSRPVPIEEIGGGIVRRTIEASEAERQLLARRFGLQAIDTLTATVSLEPLDKGRLVVARGTLDAEITQTCVVSLEPLPRKLTETFMVRMAVAPEPGEAPVVDVDPTLEDEPEPLEGDSVDVGELVAQHLSIALDPYPRSEGVELELDSPSAGNAASDGPFAELARLKPKA